MIQKYLNTVYSHGGRGPQEYDCWGLVRDARVEMFGRAELPALADVRPGRVRDITHAVSAVSCCQGLIECNPAPGAIATAWRASLCVHVGIVVEADGRMWVLETDEPTGPALTRLEAFKRRYTKVEFYD